MSELHVDLSVKEPLVTIIMPAFNAASFLPLSIGSVIKQTWQNWHLIVVNDGSTDETPTYLDALNDDRITVVHQQNSGVSTARNVALAMAKGDFITFLDADDYLPPDSIAVRAKFLLANTDVDICDGRISVRDESMKGELRQYQPYYVGTLLDRLIALDERVFFSVVYFCRAEALRGRTFQTGMTHAEDLLFYIDASHHNDVTYGFVDSVIYHYRQSSQSAMSNLSGLQKGYEELLRSIHRLGNVSYRRLILLRFKVTKIMVLSWLAKKEFIQAIFALRLLFSR